MEKLPVEKTAQKVSLKNKLAFACGDIFGGGSFNIINFLFVPFLTLTVGIPMYWVSVIMLISKVWDGIIDPFIGKISDGKRAAPHDEVSGEKLLHMHKDGGGKS